MTTHTQPWSRRFTVAATGLCLAVTLAACTTPSDDPTPEPTASTTATPTPEPTATPSVDPVEVAKQQHIDEAKTAYTAYIDKINEVEKAGMQGWEQVVALTGSAELREERRSYYEQTVAQGLTQTGDRMIATLTVTEYIPDPTGLGAEQVKLDACLDVTDADLVNPEGVSVLLAGYPTRLINEVLMQHQADGRWTVDAATTNEERPC